MSDLFVRLLKFTRLIEAKEDVFTECLASTLKEDEELAKDFVELICGRKEMEGIKIQACAISTMTQRSYPGELAPGSCLDMVFSIGHDGSTFMIGVENKLGSPQGPGQLLKYLKLPELSGVGYITPDHQKIEEKVSHHPRYLKPSAVGRDHFMWTDFYRLVEKSSQRSSSKGFSGALLTLFKDRGFEPPISEIGDLQDSEPEIRDKNRKNFAKFWELTRSRLKDRGWSSFEPGTIAELYVRQGESRVVSMMWLDPMWRAGSIRVRLSFANAGFPEKARNLLQAADYSFHDLVEMQALQVRRKNELRPILDVWISQRKLFTKPSDAQHISQRLADFTTSIFDQVQKMVL
jgi:hypothetical protein